MGATPAQGRWQCRLARSLMMVCTVCCTYAMHLFKASDAFMLLADLA